MEPVLVLLLINAALSTAISATYDSANEKVVISYRDVETLIMEQQS